MVGATAGRPSLKFPRFAGGNPSSWIITAWLFFDYYGANEEQRLLISSVHMDGDALQWLLQMNHIAPEDELQWLLRTNHSSLFRTWLDFTEALEARFGNSEYVVEQSIVEPQDASQVSDGENGDSNSVVIVVEEQEKKQSSENKITDLEHPISSTTFPGFLVPEDEDGTGEHLLIECVPAEHVNRKITEVDSLCELLSVGGFLLEGVLTGIDSAARFSPAVAYFGFDGGGNLPAWRHHSRRPQALKPPWTKMRLRGRQQHRKWRRLRRNTATKMKAIARGCKQWQHRKWRCLRRIPAMNITHVPLTMSDGMVVTLHMAAVIRVWCEENKIAREMRKKREIDRVVWFGSRAVLSSGRVNPMGQEIEPQEGIVCEWMQAQEVDRLMSFSLEERARQWAPVSLLNSFLQQSCCLGYGQERQNSTNRLVEEINSRPSPVNVFCFWEAGGQHPNSPVTNLNMEGHFRKFNFLLSPSFIATHESAHQCLQRLVAVGWEAAGTKTAAEMHFEVKDNHRGISAVNELMTQRRWFQFGFACTTQDIPFLLINDAPFNLAPPTYHIVMKKHVDNNKIDRGLQLKEELLEKGFFAGPVVCNHLILGLVKKSELGGVFTLHKGLMKKLGFVSDGSLGTVVSDCTRVGALLTMVAISMLESNGSIPCVGDLLDSISMTSVGISMLQTEGITNMVLCLGIEMAAIDCDIPMLNEILYLLRNNEALQVAYVNEAYMGRPLVECYSIPVEYAATLEGVGGVKPENQNHAITFICDAVQTIAMNQDKYTSSNGFLGTTNLRFRDDPFWLAKPELLLCLIHLVLLQIAFALEPFFLVLVAVLVRCMLIWMRLSCLQMADFGVSEQLLYNYSTLLLYILFGHMGSDSMYTLMTWKECI